MLTKVVSGGQTGVDRAALDAALEAGLAVGGWCPRGRLAEDGPIPDRYPLAETPTAHYPERTRRNVADADATLLLHLEFPLPTSPGSTLTLRLMRASGKPWRQVNLDVPSGVPHVAAWLRQEGIATLNVAGPREGRCPGVYGKARAFLADVFRLLGESPGEGGRP